MPDFLMDLGGGNFTKLSMILMVVPPELVTLEVPAQGEPTAYVRLVSDLGILPCYQPTDELAEFIDDNAPGLLPLGRDYYAATAHIVACVGADFFKPTEGIPPPDCYVQMDDGEFCPAYVSQITVTQAIQAQAAGFFGG